jgi:hypothetical protein
MMAGEKIELMLPAELVAQIRQVADALGIADLDQAVRIALDDWLAQHRDRIDTAAPADKYFVNDALDELVAKQRK